MADIRLAISALPDVDRPAALIAYQHITESIAAATAAATIASAQLAQIHSGLDELRVYIKATEFDLWATRRERDELQRRLSDNQPEEL